MKLGDISPKTAVRTTASYFGQNSFTPFFCIFTQNKWHFGKKRYILQLEKSYDA